MVKTNRLGTLAAVVGLLMAAGLLVLMLVVEARPAEATFPGKTGKIAYVSNTGGKTLTTCSSEPVVLARSAAVVAASSAFLEPSVARSIFVGKETGSSRTTITGQ